MKKIVTSLVLGIVASSAIAAGTYNVVKVRLVDDSDVRIVLSDRIHMTFDDENLIVTGGDTDVTIEKARVTGFVHEYEAGAGVGTLSESAFDGKCMRFFSLPVGSEVRVFAADGSLVYSAQAEGDATVSLEGLPKGTYVVSVNKMSYKIMVK